MKFIGRAYLNRRYTRLVPSCVIAGVVAIAFLVSLPSLHAQKTEPLGIAIDLALIALQTLLYPFARETYFRLTGPIRASMPLLIVPLPILAAVYIGKLFVFLLLVAVAVPLGIVGFIYLSISEYRGTSSYRLN